MVAAEPPGQGESKERKMKRIGILSMTGLMALSCLMTSCNEDMENPKLPTTSGTQLQVAPYISTSLSTRAEKNNWAQKDSIGVFVCTSDGKIDSPYLGKDSYSNVLYSYENSLWNSSKEVNLGTEKASVFAYYPYTAGADPKALDISLEDQTDYLYGKADTLVNYLQKTATIKMKHAMTQFVLQLTLGKYDGEGIVSQIKLVNQNSAKHIVDGGKMNIENGEISGGTAEDRIIWNDSTELKGSKLNLATILVPTGETLTAGDIRLEITIDGKVFYYDFKAGTDWKAGYKNIYRSAINSNELIIDPENGIVIEPWVDKSDNPDVELIPVS